jgi:hypothetical protein
MVECRREFYIVNHLTCDFSGSYTFDSYKLGHLSDVEPICLMISVKIYILKQHQFMIRKTAIKVAAINASAHKFQVAGCPDD